MVILSHFEREVPPYVIVVSLYVGFATEPPIQRTLHTQLVPDEADGDGLLLEQELAAIATNRMEIVCFIFGVFSG